DDGQEIDPLGGRKVLREMINANPGDWFSSSQIRQDILDVTRHYRDRGYAFADIVPQTQLNLEDRIVDITVQIKRGPPVTIERIHIGGNSKTRDKVIRREIRIYEGELYNQTLVEKSKARIQALGYFERIDVSEEQGSTPNRMILNFEVTERQTGSFQVGAGFSSIESFIFTAQIQQDNFLGFGQTLALQLQISGIRQLIQIQFVEPYLFDTEWTGIFEVFKTIRQFSEFTRDSTGGAITLGHPILHENLRFYLRYYLEYVDISARTGGLLGAAGNSQGLNFLQLLPIANLFNDGYTSSLRPSLSWDTRNNRITPTEGVFSTISTEVADQFLGSDNVFIRNRAFFRFYKGIWGPFVFKTNLEWGLITSRLEQGVPNFERFRLGGIFNLRGFPLNSLGPRANIPLGRDPNATPPDIGVAIGGNMQFFYNAEIEFDIVEVVGIKGVVFTDGGNAWNMEGQFTQPAALGDSTTDPNGRFNPFDLRYSWGFGIRWISPLGPLRFEWGLPFDPRPWEDAIRFDFTIGNFF
ncbi:MAG: outer membrane protein assembly factor BamA, partial [Myxococcales bacterium]|nr:outer membrane protein assembly factor BamA [Myxococcales bacterium]